MNSLHPGAPALFAVLFLAVCLPFAVYCLKDLAHRDVRYLPVWTWALIICITIPLGGLLYLWAERDSPRA
ncbi:MAG: hypothetical protein WC005_02980 [Candidatus Nanopelagicales bacterium]